MDKAVGVELWELVGELSKEPLAGALEAADTALRFLKERPYSKTQEFRQLVL